MKITPLDNYLEMILLSGETAEEITAEYVRIINDKFKNPTIQYSRQAGEMLRYGPQYTTIREVKGSFYAEIEYCFYNNPAGEDVDKEDEE